MLLTVAYFAYLDIKHFGDAVVAPLAYGVILISSPRPPNLAVKVSPYSITDRSVPELIPVLGSQPAGDVSHKPGGRLPLLSARPAVTPATLKRAATNFTAW